ncbi:MAG: DUF349 domain-containing protein [Cytophagales bacterium]
MTELMPNLTANAYGYTKDGKVYLKGYLNYPDREIGEVKESEEASLNYFVERFKLAVKKVEDLKTAVESAENKGSYLMKLIHLRQYLIEFDGLGDFIPLLQELDAIEESLNVLINQNKEKNKKTKESILEELAELKETFDWKASSLKVKELRDRWIKTGSAQKEDDEELENAFSESLTVFYERRRKFFEDREVLFEKRFENYIDVLERVKAMRNNLTENSLVPFKLLQEEWKNIGTIPASKGKDVFEEYKSVKRDIATKLRTMRRPKPRVDLRSWYHICEQIEALVKEHPATTEVKLRNLQEAWKKLGMLPNHKKEELIERFRVACEKVNEHGHLYASILRRFPNFDEKPLVERYKIQISQMRYLLSRDQEELRKTQATIQNHNAQSREGFELDKTILSRYNMLKRRVTMKQIVLREFEKSLQELT